MRKFVLAVILFLFVFSAAKAQYINRDQYTLWQGRMGIGVNISSPYSSIIPSSVHLMLGDSGTTKAFIPPRITHTSDISIPIKGMFVFCYDSAAPLYYSGSAWVKLGSGGGGGAYTASNGITLSGNDFKLGGDLTGNTTINGKNKYLFIDSLSNIVLRSRNLSFTPDVYFILSNEDGIVLNYDSSRIEIGNSVLVGAKDTITIDADNLRIQNLQNSLGTKSLRYDPSTGLVSYSDTAAGGSYADSLRRSGFTVQMRKGGIWTNQFDLPDSIPPTPTLQQVLTAGSTITSPSTLINLNGNYFTIANGLKSFIEIDLTPNYEFGEFGAVNTSTANRAKTLYSVSNQDAQFVSTAHSQYGDVSINGDVNATTNHIVYNASEHKFNNKTGFGMTTPDHPDSTVHIKGGLRIENGTQGTGKVLTSDASGGASWKYDTCTLATFSAGAGLSTDTAAFQTTTIYGSFYNDGSDTLVITKQMSVLQGSSPSITPTVYWNDSLNVTAGAVKLINSPSALTNTATGTAVTSFDNYKVPPGVWVWVATPTVGTKPTYFSLSLIGYKK